MIDAALVRDRRSGGGNTAPRWPVSSLHLGAMMFFLFSSKLGCLGSLLLSAILSLTLLALLGVINFGGSGW